MPRDNAGVYTRPFTWSEDAADGVPFSPARWDAQDNDYAEALNDLPLAENVPTVVPAGTDPATVNPGSLMWANGRFYARPRDVAVWIQLGPGITDTSGLVAEVLASAIAQTARGAANGVAPLDGSSKVPAANLPSYVDDVIEGANLAAFPGTGETGKIYVAIDTGKAYRWSGSTYVEISNTAPAWSDITGKPSTFAPSSHTHATSEVTGLDAALAGKADAAATTSALAGKQAADQDLTDIAALVRAKGALIAGGASAWTLLGVGTDGQVLTADAASAAGVKWATPGGGGVDLSANYTWTGQHTWSLGTITTSKPYAFTQTWNNAAVAFEGLTLDVTDTASASAGASSLGSSPLKLTKGGVNWFSVGKTASGPVVWLGAATGFAGAAPNSTNWILQNDGNLWVRGPSGSVILMAGTSPNCLVTGNGVSTRTTFRLSSDPYIDGDVVLNRDAANTLALRNGANAQTSRLYETYTDASNYSRLSTGLVSSRWTIKAEAAGTGTKRPLDIEADKITFPDTTNVTGMATAANVRAGTSAIVATTPKSVMDALAEVAVSYGATTTIDLATGINFAITLTGNITLANPSNVVPGKSGRIRLTQDATGGRTLSLGTNFKKPGGIAPSLTATANAIDYLYYDVVSATEINVQLNKAFS